jgi:cytochrome c-type biogenesis protein CcmH/NrfF
MPGEKIGSGADSLKVFKGQGTAMLWLILAGLSGTVVVGVAAWARGERKKVETEAARRRERARLQAEEAQLLARLNRDKAGE